MNQFIYITFDHCMYSAWNKIESLLKVGWNKYCFHQYWHPYCYLGNIIQFGICEYNFVADCSLLSLKHSRGHNHKFYFIFCSKINKKHLKFNKRKIKSKIFKRLMCFWCLSWCLLLFLLISKALNKWHKMIRTYKKEV